jgi:hypothetical protein
MTDVEYAPSEAMVESSGKLKMLDRMLPKLKADGHRVLLFSQVHHQITRCCIQQWALKAADARRGRL